MVPELTKALPLVSVVVPNYNHANYLDKRIESIVNQTYPNKELILLDDASTDESIQKLKNYYQRWHPHLITKLLISEKNSGSPFKQWKRGVEAARGELIWIAESDDYSSSEFLERLVEAYFSALSGGHRCGLLFTGSHSINEVGEKLADKEKIIRFNTVYCKPINLINRVEFVNKYLVINPIIINASAVLFEKRLFPDQHASYILKMRQSGDMSTWLEILKESDIIYVSDKLNYHRRHSGSVTHRNNARMLMMRKELVIFLSACKQYPGINLSLIIVRLNGLLKKTTREVLQMKVNYLPLTISIITLLVTTYTKLVLQRWSVFR